MMRREILTAAAVTAGTIAGGTLVAGSAAAAPGGGDAAPGRGTAPGLAKKDTLAFAAGSAIWIGTAVAGGGHHDSQDYPPPFTDDATYRELLGREFTSLSAENQMKWDFLRPDRETFRFDEADAIMDFAAEHGQVVRGHTLLWHNQNPEWLEQGGFSADELRALLKEHIETVVGRYAGRIHQWDVANEIFDDDARLREEQNIWIRELGIGIVADAFRWARAADPQAQLFFNDYNVDGINPKSDAYYALIQELLADGVPVDGFSTQGHLSTRYGFPGDLADNLQRFADLGLRTAVTELDVRMDLPDGAEPTPEQLEKQAEYYRRVTEAALSVEGCESLTLWGFVDTYSWVPVTFEGQGAATVMWEDYTRKPAYHAVRDALAAASGRAGHPALER
ncbi:1,4-beta-xylanase [Brachybacterium phenoliresistens]|uniref:Beta-xylanase n=1 Tax=Brachybacterium phenoliresistens TaxID=396014 RepID=Z9JQD5_9MICO|nr:endo-1,4-beta-xylanase [Brachybacterium phenoliresistens]EWS80409.1 1,4-beta-xylanase [Brachybacterium phenoliresistens]